MSTITRLLPLLVLPLYLILTASFAYSHCRMSEDTIASLSADNRTQLNTFHDRVNHSETVAMTRIYTAQGLEVKRDYRSRPVKVEYSNPPPFPPLQTTMDNGNNRGGDLDYSFECEAFFEWMIDAYNSAFCHVKYAIDEQDLDKHVECLASYPGAPGELKKAVKAYSLSIKDDALSELVSDAFGDLQDFAAKKSICESPMSRDEYIGEMNKYFRFKAHLDREIDENSQEGKLTAIE